MNKELMTKNKLNGKRIGVYFGTYAPFHAIHTQNLYKALAENDGVVLVVSGYKGDRGDKVGLPLYRRFRYLREAFSDEPNVVVAMLNEDNIPRYPDGWTPWVKKLENIVKKAVTNYSDATITNYSGEPDYKEKMLEYLPTWKERVIPRTENPISATMIRSDPLRYWNLINRVYRRHFTKKVLVAGAASGGKSTLVKRLARSVNAPFSTEYARDYEEKYDLTDDELTVDDYSHFFQGQYDANQKEINSPSNQGIVFCDTDSMVTEIYARMYLPKKDYKSLHDMYQNAIKNEEWDLILFIPPITNYVDDGFRNMEWEASRKEYSDNLIAEIKKQGFGNKLVILDDAGSKEDPEGFLARYEHAIDVIRDIGIDIELFGQTVSLRK